MTYHFDEIIDRRNTNSLKWDVEEKELPMWVADMNFPVVPTIQDAIIQRVKEPHFGYFMPRDDYFSSIIQWQETRNGVTGLTKECIGYENGVIGGVISALNVMCSKGDNVLVHSPTYIGFTMGLTNNGYHIVHSPLTLDADNIWRMDFEDMEKKIDEQTKIFILCNPQNPTGRVYTKTELEQIAAFCEKHQLKIIADEIHADFVFDGQFTPIININDYTRQNTIACVSCTKSFNLAGLKISGVIIKNPELFHAFKAEAVNVGIASINIFALEAMKALQIEVDE